MKCPHCSVEFHDSWSTNGINVFGNDVLCDEKGYWFYQHTTCPRCKHSTIQIGTTWTSVDSVAWFQVYPAGGNRGPVPVDVPNAIAEDYVEACNVLPISAKASAALSRRCLQHMLRAHGYRARDLAHEIDLLLNETDPAKALPRRLRETIDAIRNFGNFAAHPNEDRATLDIIDVEPHEAEWCLETIEELFEHFYVGPAVAAAKRSALNAKLTASGKPLAK